MEITEDNKLFKAFVLLSAKMLESEATRKTLNRQGGDYVHGSIGLRSYDEINPLLNEIGLDAEEIEQFSTIIGTAIVREAQDEHVKPTDAVISALAQGILLGSFYQQERIKELEDLVQ